MSIKFAFIKCKIEGSLMMIKKYLKDLLHRHQNSHRMPSPIQIEKFVTGLFSLIIPGYKQLKFDDLTSLEFALNENRKTLYSILKHWKNDIEEEIEEQINIFYTSLPTIDHMLMRDAKAILEGDPAAKNIDEVLNTYPGFFAICIYRIAHQLHLQKIPYLPRILSAYAQSKTGIDIHPAAEIGTSFFIDHGTGIVIGETTRIGNHVKIYQGVTLGALSVKKHLAETKRHPTIKDHVVIYAGATILGGHTIIGEYTTIGGNAWITNSIESHTAVYHQADHTFKKKNKNVNTH